MGIPTKVELTEKLEEARATILEQEERIGFLAERLVAHTEEAGAKAEVPTPYVPHATATQTLQKLAHHSALDSNQVIEALLMLHAKTIRVRSLAGVVAGIKQVRKAHKIA